MEIWERAVYGSNGWGINLMGETVTYEKVGDVLEKILVIRAVPYLIIVWWLVLVPLNCHAVLKIVTHSYCADEHDCCKSCDRYSTFSTVRPDYRSYMLLLCLPFLCALDTANSCTYECAQLMLNHNVVYLSKSTDTTCFTPSGMREIYMLGYSINRWFHEVLLHFWKARV